MLSSRPTTVAGLEQFNIEFCRSLTAEKLSCGMMNVKVFANENLLTEYFSTT
jgi:hypothetical protein